MAKLVAEPDKPVRLALVGFGNRNHDWIDIYLWPIYWTGATVPVQLFRGPQVRVVSAARLVPSQALLVLHGDAGQRRARHAGSPSAQRLRGPLQALWRLLRVFCLAAQLLLPPVLIRLSGYRWILWLQRVNCFVCNCICHLGLVLDDKLDLCVHIGGDFGCWTR